MRIWSQLGVVALALCSACGGGGLPPLSRAARSGDMETARREIQQGATQADLDAALKEAAVSERAEPEAMAMAQLLLDAGAKPTRYGVVVALWHSQVAVADLFVRHGAPLGERRPRSLETPLIEYLKDSPFIPDQTPDERLENVRFLLQHGADPSGLDFSGESAFTLAPMVDPENVGRVVDLLCQHGGTVVGVRPNLPEPLYLEENGKMAIVVFVGGTFVPDEDPAESPSDADSTSHALLRRALGIGPQEPLPEHDVYRGAEFYPPGLWQTPIVSNGPIGPDRSYARYEGTQLIELEAGMIHYIGADWSGTKATFFNRKVPSCALRAAAASVNEETRISAPPAESQEAREP